MNNLWTSEDSDPIKDIEAGIASMKDGPSFKDIHDANEMYFKLHYESMLRNVVHEDYQLQIREMIDAELTKKSQAYLQIDSLYQLLKILSDHPEFRIKRS